VEVELAVGGLEVRSDAVTRDQKGQSAGQLQAFSPVPQRPLPQRTQVARPLFSSSQASSRIIDPL
jgi:hypothetical protein